MTYTSTFAVFFAAALMVGGPLHANRPFLQQDVADLDMGVFEVVGRIGDGAADYWCGAGDYAQRYLRAGATERLYIWRALGPSVSSPGKKAVQFAFRAPTGSDTTPGLSLSVQAVGDNMTVSSAAQYCFDRVKFER